MGIVWEDLLLRSLSGMGNTKIVCAVFGREKMGKTIPFKHIPSHCSYNVQRIMRLRLTNHLASSIMGKE